MYHGTSALQHQTLQHLIVFCQQLYACFACIDINNMYLQTPMTDYEYMRIPRHLIPKEFIDKYGLENKMYKGFLYCEIQRVFMDFPNLVNLQTHF